MVVNNYHYEYFQSFKDVCIGCMDTIVFYFLFFFENPSVVRTGLLRLKYPPTVGVTVSSIGICYIL